MLSNSKLLSEEFLKEFRKKYWESKNLPAPSTDTSEQYWQSKGMRKPADKSWPSALDGKGLPGRAFDSMAPRYKDMSGWFSGDD